MPCCESKSAVLYRTGKVAFEAKLVRSFSVSNYCWLGFSLLGPIVFVILALTAGATATSSPLFCTLPNLYFFLLVPVHLRVMEGGEKLLKMSDGTVHTVNSARPCDKPSSWKNFSGGKPAVELSLTDDCHSAQVWTVAPSECDVSTLVSSVSSGP